MKNDFLYVLKRVEEITGEEPCKKKMQKLIYLIENSSKKLGYDYSMHFYGPYSAQLNDEMNSLCYEDKIEFIYKGMSHCLNAKIDNVELENETKKDSIDRILEKYAVQSPNDLERITTTLYVMQNINCQTENDVVKKVIDIKHSKYKADEILKDIKNIKAESLFEPTKHSV